MPKVEVSEERSDGWYLFMDLLAVQYLAQANPQGLFQNFRDFFQIILGAASSSPALTVYTLSDSAMVHADELSDIIQFVRKVRAPLFQAGVFFKGGIAEGETSYFRATGIDNFHGVSFAGPGASNAYAGQARLNSTDVIVLSRDATRGDRAEQLKGARARGDIVRSIYYDPGAPSEYVEFSALALGSSELGVVFDVENSEEAGYHGPEGTGAIEVVLQNYWYAKHLDKRASAKFVSLLTNIALHSRFEAATLVNGSNWQRVTPLFRKLFIDKSGPNAFIDPAFNIIYAIATSKILNARTRALELEKDVSADALEKIYCDPTVHSVLNTVLKRRSFMSSMKSLPPSVFEHGSGDLMFRLYGFRQQLIASNTASKASH
ncbi:MAG: hypothetical protein KJ676_10230 [Alphaproteobacteria bacterium]|nr:hypothetical protein [Alphaproteobacteria bacterium]MBU1527084.1 hypothetical protein [Alphaproteobacteria bacterium]MBU2349990.1 hypothetical protein [Alphaproteobacteria bacterium]MBU2382953.1 hypothetical protein [Alphaproteobacteria bacterium]